MRKFGIYSEIGKAMFSGAPEMERYRRAYEDCDSLMINGREFNAHRHEPSDGVRNHYYEELRRYLKLSPEEFEDWGKDESWVRSKRYTKNGDSTLGIHMARDLLVQLYSWGIPNEAAIQAMSQGSPLIDIGCGTGYWAWLIKQAGGTVYSFDTFLDDELYWTDVRRGNEWAVRRFGTCYSLMLVWPPYATSMAYNALRLFRGDLVFYVGENYGCCGDDNFHQLLYDKFECLGEIPTPVYDGIHDKLMIWCREKSKKRIWGVYKRNKFCEWLEKNYA